MHGVLQPLHELLAMRDPRLERPNLILFRIDAGRLSRLISFCAAANLADPRDQSLRRSHTSPPGRSLGRCRAERIPPTLFLGHLADHQRTALDLLANQFELRLALLLSSLPGALHLVTSPRRTIEPITVGGPDSRPGRRAPAIDTDAPIALTT
jgi:hypothetical protein